MLFAESGLSAAQISSLFILWSAVTIVVEIPSGVLADVVSRRLLLILSPLLAGAAFALWVAVPSYPAFAAGFVLWGTGSALQSGAREALVYEELDRLGASARYARVIGRATAAGTVALAAAMLAAGPVFGIGGYSALGVASVVACVLAAAAAAGLPEHRDTGVEGEAAAGALRAFATTLREGATQVRSRRRVRIAVGILVAVSAIWASLEEYVGLLAVDAGVATADVPVLILVVYVGIALGGLLGGVAGRLPRWATAAVLAAAAVALAAGALWGTVAGFALIGAAFCAFQMVEIAANTRLQEAISGPARSTVTSVAGLGVDVAGIAVYATYGAASLVAGHGTIFAGWAAVYLIVAAVIVHPPVRRRRRTGG